MKVTLEQRNRAYQIGFQDGFCQREPDPPNAEDHDEWRALAVAYCQGIRDGSKALAGPYEHEVVVYGDRVIESIQGDLSL